jgi:hypothetical protein
VCVCGIRACAGWCGWRATLARLIHNHLARVGSLALFVGSGQPHILNMGKAARARHSSSSGVSPGSPGTSSGVQPSSSGVQTSSSGVQPSSSGVQNKDPPSGVKRAFSQNFSEASQFNGVLVQACVDLVGLEARDFLKKKMGQEGYENVMQKLLITTTLRLDVNSDLWLKVCQPFGAQPGGIPVTDDEGNHWIKIGRWDVPDV